MTPKTNTWLKKWKNELTGGGLILFLIIGYLTVWADTRDNSRRIKDLEETTVKKDVFEEIRQDVRDIKTNTDTIRFRQWRLELNLYNHINKEK